MKKILFFFLVLAFVISCKKNCGSMQSKDSQVTSGTLYYSDPAVDGPGLFYVTDGKESILFKNEFADYYTEYLHYKDLVGVHSQLTYKDTGETGCTLGMVPCEQQHKLRIVQVLKLEKF